MKQSQVTVSMDILFEDRDVEFLSGDYHQPIKYRIDNLYGYFPLHKAPKYLRLSDFNYAFAEFQKPDGTKGWIDIRGREYPSD